MATRRKPKQPKPLGTLIREVFTTPSGKDLLDELNRVYVQTRGFDNDPYKTAYMAGERGLVLTLMFYTNQPVMEEDENDGRDESEFGQQYAE